VVQSLSYQHFCFSAFQLFRYFPLMPNWTRDQLLAALNLYHRTPFGRQHKTYPPIVELAALMGRTPSAVAMKLNNFTSLDPVEAERGVHGLTGASNADRAIWEEFYGRMNDLAEESEAALERLAGETPSQPTEREPTPPSGPSESTAIVKIRRQQTFFRKAVLGSYGHRCCITGNPVPELLRASHIVPWSQNETHRANPRNGLCLAATFDAAFDRGLITLDDKFCVLLSPKLKTYLPNPELERTFLEAEGRRITLPEKNLPDLGLIAQHKAQVFGARM
jgi:putative restriction endonuclease